MIHIRTNHKELFSYLKKNLIPVSKGNTYISKVFLPFLLHNNQFFQSLLDFIPSKNNMNEELLQSIEKSILFLNKQTDKDILIQFNSDHTYNQSLLKLRSYFINKDDKDNFLFFTHNYASVCNSKHKFIAIGLEIFSKPPVQSMSNLIENCGLDSALKFVLFHEFSHLIEKENSLKNHDVLFSTFYNGLKNDKELSLLFSLYRETYADIYSLLLMKKSLVEENNFSAEKYQNILNEIVNFRTIDKEEDHDSSGVIHGLSLIDDKSSFDKIAQHLAVKNIYQTVIENHTKDTVMFNMLSDIISHLKLTPSTKNKAKIK